MFLSKQIFCIWCGHFSIQRGCATPIHFLPQFPPILMDATFFNGSQQRCCLRRWPWCDVNTILQVPETTLKFKRFFLYAWDNLYLNSCNRYVAFSCLVFFSIHRFNLKHFSDPDESSFLHALNLQISALLFPTERIDKIYLAFDQPVMDFCIYEFSTFITLRIIVGRYITE